MQNYAKAEVKYVRISPRKVKIVIDLIRNKPVGEALAILKHTPKAASEVVEKLLLSAMANAENNHGMDVEKLYVAEIYSNAGPILKRIRPRAQGRAFRIFKRTSHTTIILKELGAKEEVVAPKPEVKEVKAEPKPEVKKEEVKEEVKKAPAKKTTTSTKTTAEKKTTTTKKATTEKSTEKAAEKKPAAKKTTSTAAKTTTKKTTAKKADGEEAPKPSKPRAKKADTAKTEEA